MDDVRTNHSECIDRMANGFRDAQILITANRLGVFGLLESGAKSLSEMASALGASQRGLAILCDALVALALLEKHEGLYRNSELARACLLPGSPTPKSAILLHHARLYERWGRLFRTVREGRPAEEAELDEDLRFDEGVFARAMADSARAMVSRTVEVLELSDIRSLLDIGGGPGLYAIEFCKRHPRLEATILDNEKTLEVAARNVESAGLAGRIRLLPGDALADDLGGDYQFIFLSNVIHSYSEEQNAHLVRRCAASLAPNGRLCIKDFILEPGRTAPPGAAIFAVNMLVNTERGNCYTVAEVESWLSTAGLVFEQRQILSPQTSLILGRKG